MYFTLRVKLKAKDTNIIMHNKRVVSEDQLNFNSEASAESKFLISVNCCEQTGGVNINLHECLSPLAPE